MSASVTPASRTLGPSTTGRSRDRTRPKRLVTLRSAKKLVGRSRRPMLTWQADGMPTELLGGTRHVRVCDLLDWQRTRGRRHGRARDTL